MFREIFSYKLAQDMLFFVSGKEPRRKRWSADETAVLNEKFGPYIGTVRETDIKDILPRLPGRTAAQVRARLNNMKLGKSK